ncbi:HAD-IA family hydrolase [Pararhodobacter aggregans]|uniref:phosphoglycolate phosphatase n=1 Tax=Pararhodobacter aggregans TaxID=404875 RepID=A0A2T7UX25_9RHOB|nr:HAD-IA family hydrolase [Pararhodobacter aggregans]PTX05013.1 phosphoglycolate phosphatase [Pararhodobacter aggregans]PVE49330.1 phosphoglycolate phosphatase [Pararhodobacter aggregans]
MRIVFDLDGTLIDSAPDLHVAINRVLGEWGAKPLDLSTLTRFIGNGIPALVSLARQSRGIPLEEQPLMTARMFAHYTAAPADLTRPYPHVIPTLQRLVGQGAKLGLCTNKAEAPTLGILSALRLERFFVSVVGGDTMPTKKPDAAPLLAAFEGLGGPGLYIGDSEVDAETAVRARVRFGLYTRGYRKTPVDGLPHDFAFDDYAALPGLLAAERCD